MLIIIIGTHLTFNSKYYTPKTWKQCKECNLSNTADVVDESLEDIIQDHVTIVVQVDINNYLNIIIYNPHQQRL